MSKSIYTHKHHIIPRHAGGSDDPSNIKELTIEEHAEAHKKLFFIYGRWEDEVAWLGLSRQIGKEEIIRRSITHKGKDNGMYGKKHTDETKAHLSKVRKGRKWTKRKRESSKGKQVGEKNSFWGKKHTQETKDNIRQQALGRKHTEEAKKKMSEAKKGSKQTEEHKKKRIEAYKATCARRTR
tara:strand:+ start:1585 stop:2130 length:546 start_codon:yes stop_codon:yes gene_type:complete